MKLEINKDFVRDAEEADLARVGIGVTPPIFGDYWKYRVQVTKKQAIIGFPKFFTIGIGFQYEEDWNTNLPWTSKAKDIYKHIRHNRLNARREKCIEAIKMIQKQVKIDHGNINSHQVKE